MLPLKDFSSGPVINVIQNQACIRKLHYYVVRHTSPEESTVSIIIIIIGGGFCL